MSNAAINEPVIKIEGLSIAYEAGRYAVNNVTTAIRRNSITAIMGPSGCGKSTLLRAINRLHELYRNIETKGEILLDGRSIFSMSVIELRRKVGMVFQRPNPFPNMTIYENVVAAYSLNDIRLKKRQRDEIVENALRNVGLWDEVKEFLYRKGTFLSGGQQQRLCVARAIAFNPEVLLLDEPTSALDPLATSRIEDLLGELKKNYTIVLVTHNMSQAARISDDSIFMYLGELVESGPTTTLFTNPKDARTEAYLTGKFG
ncbi:MAG TPA: phosphate ABC transporter ATP-binding protein [Bacteroidales bacterium]|nr:phosphate ABC transporter ATP-binding protein [Bacteroidales bacterium]HCI55613.1 phosphate ABC transporter ATP-binding protein [Bacteroidales bacterium]HOU95867.1 phosphate ABC transporter ATP-binding protein [Bacteroidales bacterium]HQG35904.1 phosphate ABC transporter ATP-binding protein [Bacteroidales bacterium]HQG52414.1 phosphate ABC transporter ATP-binding protein [Bacteroidales bacterium]